MANISVSVDEKTARKARLAAVAMGTSLSQLLRDHIQHLAGKDQQRTDHDSFEARTLASKGRLNGWKFDREAV